MALPPSINRSTWPSAMGRSSRFISRKFWVTLLSVDRDIISCCNVDKKTYFFWNMRDLLCKAKSEGGRGRWGLPQRLNIILLRKMHSSYDYQLYKISFLLYVILELVIICRWVHSLILSSLCSKDNYLSSLLPFQINGCRRGFGLKGKPLRQSLEILICLIFIMELLLRMYQYILSRGIW